MDTKDAGVKQAPAGRDYCNLCHCLNGFPSHVGRGIPTSQWTMATVEQAWQNGWTHLGLLSDAAGFERHWRWQPQRDITCCVGPEQRGLSKDSGWMVAWIEKYWQSTQMSRGQLLTECHHSTEPLRNIPNTLNYIAWYGGGDFLSAQTWNICLIILLLVVPAVGLPTLFCSLPLLREQMGVL